MKLIVGLGNVGSEYTNTRHNIGFIIIDKILQNLDSKKISKNFKGELFQSGDYLFLKPSTYMNLSGESVVLVRDFYKIDNKDIIVIHDDIDLKLGALKIKNGGSDGGHNGIKSIDKHIGNSYYRIRVGIGRPENREKVVDYVLGRFKDEELDALSNSIQNAQSAVFDIENREKYLLKG